jgi:hypothetical protein
MIQKQINPAMIAAKQTNLPGNNVYSVNQTALSQPAAATAQDPRVTALEQKVAALDAVVQQLASILVISSNGHKAVLKADTIEVDASMDLKLKAGSKISIQASGNLSLKGNGSVTLESPSALEVKSTGTTRIKGALITLNDGTKGVARQSDIVLGAGAVGAITGGNPTVLA